MSIVRMPKSLANRLEMMHRNFFSWGCKEGEPKVRPYLVKWVISCKTKMEGWESRMVVLNQTLLVK